MKRTIVLLLCCCMLIGLLAACGKKDEPLPSTPPIGSSAITEEDVSAKFAGSYEEIFDALAAAKENMGKDHTFVTGDEVVEDAEVTEESNSEGLYYSGTNVQVEGVDEGDIVKTDGTYLYILREYEFIIMQVNGAEVTDVSDTMVGAAVDNEEQVDGSVLNSEKSPQELYLCGDRAVIVSTYYDYYEMPDGNTSAKNFTSIDIYDITNREAPALVTSLGQDGYTVSSRMIDNTVYLVTSYYPDKPVEGQEDTFVPCLYQDGARAALGFGSVAMIPNDDTMTFAVLASYSIPDAAIVSSQAILGGGDTVYMNMNNLYLCRLVYSDTVSDTKQEDPYTVTTHTESVDTVITRYAVADKQITFGACGTVAGGLLNQFSLDEKDGNLRVVTTEDRSNFSVYVDESNDFENTKFLSQETSNDLFVLDADLKPVGSITGIAEGEKVYSVRFDGDWGYLCTYRETDPVFAVSLADPAKPEVTGQVKLTGYSDYLHIWNDELLFGLGMETQDVTDESGTVTKVDGMKMVMINKADPANLSEAGTASVNADYSEALTNHKAILVDPARNLIAFPAESSYLVYGYTPEEGFALKSEVAVSEWDWSNRGIVIGDYFYVCGSDRVNVIDLNTLENLGETIISRG